MSSGEPRGKSWISGSHLSTDSRKCLSGDPDIEFTVYSYDQSSSSDSDTESETPTIRQSQTHSTVVNLSDSELSIETTSSELQQTCDFPAKDIPLDRKSREDMLTFLNSCVVEEGTKE